MSRIGIVCDSTCDLGPTWLAEHDVVMVALKVTFGEETFLDWVELSPEAFFERLASSPTLPKTSQPSPAEFAAVYERLAADGVDGIVSIHLSSPLSGTIESANMAAADASVPVRVIDTRRVNMGTGLAILGAIEARDAGADLNGVADAAETTARKTHMLFALDTLDYLVKGGRAGKAQGLAASLLNIKPVLTFNDEGIIEPFKKVKGTRKAIAEMAAEVAAVAGSGTVRVAVLHSLAPDLVEQMTAALDESGAHYELANIAEVGAVIGTYAGPRALGVAFHTIG